MINRGKGLGKRIRMGQRGSCGILVLMTSEVIMGDVVGDIPGSVKKHIMRLFLEWLPIGWCFEKLIYFKHYRGFK